MIIDSLGKIPIQHKKDLISNIILAGGNTKAPNFADRLAQEVSFSILKTSDPVNRSVSIQEAINQPESTAQATGST
jgi:actin-related protein